MNSITPNITNNPSQTEPNSFDSDLKKQKKDRLIKAMRKNFKKAYALQEKLKDKSSIQFVQLNDQILNQIVVDWNQFPSPEIEDPNYKKIRSCQTTGSIIATVVTGIVEKHYGCRRLFAIDKQEKCHGAIYFSILPKSKELVVDYLCGSPSTISDRTKSLRALTRLLLEACRIGILYGRNTIRLTTLEHAKDYYSNLGFERASQDSERRLVLKEANFENLPKVINKPKSK